MTTGPIATFGLFGESKVLTATEQPVTESRVHEPALHVGEGIKSGWLRSHVRRLAASDAAVIVASVAIAQLARFGTVPATFRTEALVYSYTAVSAVLILAWFSALFLFRSREARVIGTGAEEFRRVARASTALFGSVAIVSFLLKLEVARGYLAVALPLGLATLLLTPAGFGGDGSQRNGLKGASSLPSSWSVRTMLPAPWRRSSSGCEPRAIESLAYVFLVGEPAEVTPLMSTDMLFRSLVMRLPL